jgi:outer membrane protein OmpA-like peptidoglycan-associated protein
MMPERSCRWIVLSLLCCVLTPLAASSAAAKKNVELDRAESLLRERLSENKDSAGGAVIVRDTAHLTLRIPAALLFQTDSTSLKPDAISCAPLAATLRLLKRRRALAAQIVVYTDSIGSPGTNLGFSEQRAATLSDALHHAGISKLRLQPRGAGQSEALAENETAEGRQQNRRVEITFQRAPVTPVTPVKPGG